MLNSEKTVVSGPGRGQEEADGAQIWRAAARPRRVRRGGVRERAHVVSSPQTYMYQVCLGVR